MEGYSMKRDALIKNLHNKFNLNAVYAGEFYGYPADGSSDKGIWIRDDICKKETGWYNYANDTMDMDNILNQYLRKHGWHTEAHDAETIMIYPN